MKKNGGKMRSKSTRDISEAQMDIDDSSVVESKKKVKKAVKSNKVGSPKMKMKDYLELKNKSNKRKRKNKVGSASKNLTKKRKMKNETGSEVHEPLSSEEDYIVKCRPSSICSLIPLLNENQRLGVEQIGFGGVLQFGNFSSVSWVYATWFLKNFNPTTQLLCFSDNEKFVVTPDDIHDLFLLPRQGGQSVLGGRDDKFIKSFVQDLKNRYPGNNIMTLKGVRRLILDVLTDGGEDFKLFFVLYCMSSCFAPTMNITIDLSLVRSMVDVQSISSIDWCSYVVSKLCKAMHFLRKNPSKKNVSGCVLVLSLLYFHHLKWRGKAEPSSLPLIKHWNCEKFKKRLVEETRAGGFGQGVWIRDVYPVNSHMGRQSEPCVDVHVDVPESQSKRYVRYMIPPDEKNDAEIHSIAQDALDESFMLLKRDLSVVTLAHTDRLKDIMDSVQKFASKPSPSPCSTTASQQLFASNKFCQHVDEIVAAFTSMQEKSKESFPAFQIATSHSPLNDPCDSGLNDILESAQDEFDDDDVEDKDVEDVVSPFTSGEELKTKFKEPESSYDGPTFHLLSQPSPIKDNHDLDIGADDSEVCKQQPMAMNLDSENKDPVEDEKDVRDLDDLDGDADDSEAFEQQPMAMNLDSENKDRVEDGKVIRDPVNPWIVADDEWEIDNSILRSSFVKKNARNLKSLTMKERCVADYFFHNHRALTLSSDSNVFAYDGIFFLSFSSMTSLNDGELIHISVLDIWALLLNIEEKYLAWSKSSQQKKCFFNGQYSVYLDHVLRLKRDLMSSGEAVIDAYEDARSSLRGCWEYYLGRLYSSNVLLSVDLIFLSVHSKDHFFVVVIDFPQKIIHYCDNREYISVTNTNYWQLMIVLRDEFSTYLKQIGHPKASEMNSYDIVEVQFEWKKECRGVDCGVFVMHTM